MSLIYKVYVSVFATAQTKDISRWHTSNPFCGLIVGSNRSTRENSTCTTWWRQTHMPTPRNGTPAAVVRDPLTTEPDIQLHLALKQEQHLYLVMLNVFYESTQARRRRRLLSTIIATAHLKGKKYVSSAPILKCSGGLQFLYDHHVNLPLHRFFKQTNQTTR